MSDKQLEIQKIISQAINKAIKKGKTFKTFDLAQEVYDELEKKNLIELALIGYLQYVIYDVLDREYAIPIESLQ